MSETRERLVLQGNAYNQFINAVRTQASRHLYNTGLKNFMIFYHLDEVKEMLAWDTRLAEANIISWLVSLRDKEKLSSSTITSYLAAVMFFYKINDIELRRWKIGKYLPEDARVNEDRAYTHQEIARLLQFCDYRTKALVLLLASSGMRIGAVPELKVKHLTKIEKYNFYKVKLYAKSKKDEHFSFTTPEAANALESYFAYRQRYGERINDDSPVFREQFNSKDLLKIRHPKTVSTHQLSDLLRETLQRAGIFQMTKMVEGQRNGQKRNEVPRAHGFRKFFQTNLIRAKLHDPVPELLMGHDIGLKKHYVRLDEDEILQEYVNAVDHLTINEENRLRLENQQLRAKGDKLNALQEQMERLEKRLGLQAL